MGGGVICWVSLLLGEQPCEWASTSEQKEEQLEGEQTGSKRKSVVI